MAQNAEAAVDSPISISAIPGSRARRRQAGDDRRQSAVCAYAGPRFAVTSGAGQKWIIANFKETQVAGMKIGQSITFTVDALAHARLSGRIKRSPRPQARSSA